jgi:hypothetical protein
MGLNIHTNLWHMPQSGLGAFEPRRRTFDAALALSTAAASREQILRHPLMAILAQAALIPPQAEGLLADA